MIKTEKVDEEYNITDNIQAKPIVTTIAVKEIREEARIDTRK